MFSSLLPLGLVLFVFTACVSAHLDWIKALPDCWRDCLENTKDSCDSQKCVCDAGQSDRYLPPAVSCAATTCDADEVALTIALLFPLEGYCELAGNAIPEEVLSSAYAVAAGTAYPTTTEQRKPSSTHEGEHSERPKDHKTTHKEQHRVTETLTSTMTKTTTDSEGQTLEIIVPVVIGPNTMSFGKTTTSTLEADSSATETPSSASATPSPTMSPTPKEQPEPPSSTSSKGPEDTSISNGSPFENMQAEAGQWRVSSIFLGLGAAAGVFMGL